MNGFAVTQAAGNNVILIGKQCKADCSKLAVELLCRSINVDDPELLCNSEASGSVLSCLRRIWHCVKSLLQLISYQKLYLMEGYLVQGICNTI